MSDLHATLRTRVADVQPRLVELSHALHADPELGFREHRSATRVADALEREGFAVRRGVGELETALVAQVGDGPMVVSVCAEYDALPGVGHACGHNVIAAAAVGAGVALAGVADDLGLTVRVVGTPAEEGGGGKIYLMEDGAFDGSHLAMMVHPFPREQPSLACLASQEWAVAYHGRSAHAAAFPHEGLNAADAVTVAQVGIGLLRQHLHAGDRVHGVVTDGGDAPNVIPEHAGGRWICRADDLAGLRRVQARTRPCFEAGALATGTRLELVPQGPAFSEFRHDPELEAIWLGHLPSVGRAPSEPGAASPGGPPGSTDMANVSLAIPSIHPMIRIEANGASNHQPAFTAACATPSADLAVHDGALLLAMTAADAALDDALRARLLARTFTAADLENRAQVPLEVAKAVHA